MTIRGISLTRFEESLTPYANRGDCFRIRIEALDAVGMPVEVFLHRKMLINAHTGLEGEEFIAVISPEDAVIYPVDIPNTLQSPPFFRKDTIDVIVASRDMALEMWDAVRSRVCELVEAYNRKDRLVAAETVRCGDEDETSSSVSVSESL